MHQTFQRNVPAEDIFWRNPSNVEDYKKVIEILERIDEKLGLKDCGMEQKTSFIRDLEKRVADLENQTNADTTLPTQRQWSGKTRDTIVFCH
jgi:hypothetical protein